MHVIAIITAKPGQREAVLTQFHAVIPAVLAEDGRWGAVVGEVGHELIMIILVGEQSVCVWDRTLTPRSSSPMPNAHLPIPYSLTIV